MSKFLRRSLVIFIHKVFRTIVFIFIVMTPSGATAPGQCLPGSNGRTHGVTVLGVGSLSF